MMFTNSIEMTTLQAFYYYVLRLRKDSSLDRGLNIIDNSNKKALFRGVVDIMMQFKWRRDECALFWHVVKTTMSCRGAKMLMVMVLVSYALTSLSPYLNGQFVDMLVYGQDMHSIYILAFAIALLGIISAVFSYFAKMLQTSVLNLSYFSFFKRNRVRLSTFCHLQT